MEYVAASTEKEIAVNVAHRNFGFLENICCVREATFYQCFANRHKKASIFNREGKRHNYNNCYKRNT